MKTQEIQVIQTIKRECLAKSKIEDSPLIKVRLEEHQRICSATSILLQVLQYF